MRLTAGLAALPLFALLSFGCVDLTRPPGLVMALPASGGVSGTVLEPAPDDAGREDGPAPEAAPALRDGPAAANADSSVAAADLPAPDAPAGADAPHPPDTLAPVDTPASDVVIASPNGAACALAGSCKSGFCVDGVCCESICNSPCYSCKAVGSGKCTAIAAGLDPDNECTAGTPSSCGLDGSCNGAGGCRLTPAGTTCKAAVCAGSTETSKSTCDGAGTCQAGAVRECAPYLCVGDACVTTCTTAADCKAGYTCRGGACVVAPADAGAPDASPPDAPIGAILLVDDFSDATLRTNTMGGAVTSDHQTVALVGGQVRFSWNGGSDFHDFIETFLQSFCPYDLRTYHTLRFKMRASAGPRPVKIFLPRGDASCGTVGAPLVGTISATTTLSTFDVDLTAVVRDKALFIEFSPEFLDDTDYFLDDLQLVP